MTLADHAYHLKRTFGLTLEQYQELLERQGGGCAICGRTPKQEGRSLSVDHDHHTGEIFGILCMSCNKILVGHIRDAMLFLKAAKYLTTGTGLFVPPGMEKPKRRRRRRSAKNTRS